VAPLAQPLAVASVWRAVTSSLSALATTSSSCHYRRAGELGQANLKRQRLMRMACRCRSGKAAAECCFRGMSHWQSRTGISTSHAPTFGPLLQSSELQDRTFPISNFFEHGGRSAKKCLRLFQSRADGKKITARIARLSVGGPDVGNIRWNSYVGHPLSNDPRMAAASDG
jgi:hypothetical protein